MANSIASLDDKVVAWLDEILDTLEAQPACGYLQGQSLATEPTALAALALQGHGRNQRALAAASHLADAQNADGSLGVGLGQTDPGWPTSLAVLAWLAIDDRQFQSRVQRACQWILDAHGEPLERSSEMGHDTTLIGWAWVGGTHSWLEPSALHVIALKAAGFGQHVRAREAVKLLFDRTLPAGGCNYGNTTVLGQTLLPHMQPTGIAMLALTGELDQGGRIAKSLGYLRRTLDGRSTAASLSWALLGLAAHDVDIAEAEARLAQAAARVATHDRSPHKQALLALAALGEQAPLIKLIQH